jgi:hypothetical protein
VGNDKWVIYTYTEAVLVESKEVFLEVNAEKSGYVLICR